MCKLILTQLSKLKRTEKCYPISYRYATLFLTNTFVKVMGLNIRDFCCLLFDLVMGSWNYKLYKGTENYCTWDWRHWTQDPTFNKS